MILYNIWVVIGFLKVWPLYWIDFRKVAAEYADFAGGRWRIHGAGCAQVLEKNNYIVDLAHDGEYGPDCALSGIYDIIILDTDIEEIKRLLA